MTPQDETTEAVLARIDERTRTIQTDVSEIKQQHVHHRSHVENNYVTKDRFTPVERVVYGLVGLVLLTVVGAIVAMAIHT